jgi:two-component system, cell cycle response regulator
LLAQTIAGLTAPGEILCRYGGEEFCVLLPDTDESAAVTWAQRVRQAIAAKPLVVGSDSVQLTASFGVAGRGDARQNELVERADHALREAKSAGRDRVVAWRQAESAGNDLQRMRKCASLFRNLCARDLMSAPVTCLQRSAPVADAADLLLCRKVSSAPVVNPDGSLAGIVAEREIMEALGFTDGWSAPIERFMKQGVIQYDPYTPAVVIFEFLCRVQIHRVVIVDNMRPVGLISRGTFLRWAQNYVQANGPSYVEENARPQLLQAAGALTRRAQDLNDELQCTSEEPLVPVLSGVSSMQEIMEDLLVWARCTPTTANGGSVPSTPMTSV